MFLAVLLFLALFFLTGTFFLTSISSALRRIHRKDAQNELEALRSHFFYWRIHRFFLPKHSLEGLFFCLICTQNVVRFLYATAAIAFIANTKLFLLAKVAPFGWIWVVLMLSGFILAAFILGDYIPRLLGFRFPEKMLRISSPLASLFLLATFPLTFTFLRIGQFFYRPEYLDPAYEPVGKEEIIDLIQKADLSPAFDIHDKKLIESVIKFKERIAREVMVPRVDVFSLPADTSLKEAAQKLLTEGYTRTPVYKNSVDNIIGVLMYKDLLKKYMEYVQKGNDEKILNAPIEGLVKNVLHTPETKKLSSLLQEFRKKQVHLAIVVDEYGGTEGIVTIEDILEEIVGDIADEYDLQEEVLYRALPNGDWIVDARMAIPDIEELLNIAIPQEGEYDTIGGYTYHVTGTIPSKGFVIHQDDFDLEIVDSNDRSVDKVRIRPL